jgi:hypothetical protein
MLASLPALAGTVASACQPLAPGWCRIQNAECRMGIMALSTRLPGRKNSLRIRNPFAPRRPGGSVVRPGHKVFGPQTRPGMMATGHPGNPPARSSPSGAGRAPRFQKTVNPEWHLVKAKAGALERFLGSRRVSAAAPTRLLKSRVFSSCPAARLFLPSRTRPSLMSQRFGDLIAHPGCRSTSYEG